jgi:hypothetical protein
MKSFIKTVFFVSAVVLLQANGFAQKEEQKWQTLFLNEEKKIWYDDAAVDSARGFEFRVWTLELHKPPLSITGINEHIYKSKTLYRINLKLLKYGIDEIEYFNSADKRIASYDYRIKGETDEYSYTYPVTESPVLFGILKRYIKTKEMKEN